MLSIKEYRKILNDYSTPDEKIEKRIQYLENLSRNIIRDEIKNHVEGKKTS